MSQQNIHDPALIAQRPVGTQAPLEPGLVEWLLYAFAANTQLLADARQIIKPHHFKPVEGPIRLAYEALCYTIDQYRGITFETLSHAAGTLLQQNQQLGLTPQQLEVIFRTDTTGLLWQMTHLDKEMFNDVNINFARTLLQRFANERTIVEPLRRVLNPNFNHGTPENLETFLDVVQHQQSRLSYMNEIPQFDLTPVVGSELIQSNVFNKTGLEFLDNLLDGQREGDCNGLIGPTGGGKTTLGLQMAVMNAQACWAESIESGEPPGLVVFVSVEESAAKLRPRVWSAFCNIRRDKLERLQSWDELSQPGQLEAYEQQFQPAHEQLSEIERYKAYMPQMQQCFALLDLSGSDAFPHAGNGYIPEIVSYLSRYEQPIRTVYIDYTGLLAERHMDAIGQNDANTYRRLLRSFGDNCRKQIAERFGCTVWALHQARGAANNSSPFRPMHHTDASESKEFAVNMSVCLCLGVPDVHTGCRILNISKCRYRPNEDIPKTTLRIHRQFALMEDVTTQFIPQTAQGRFISADDAGRVGGTENLANRHQGGPVGLRQPVMVDEDQQVEI